MITTRRIRRRSKMKKCLGIALFSLLLSIFCYSQDWRTCVRVVDGDTIELDGKEIVRLIGVDTPETKDPRKPVQYYGQEAYEFTKNLVEGKKVRLEYDQDRTDKYDRTLAYVFLEDGTFVNAEIILQGYGHADTEFPCKYLEEFRLFEKQARESEIGMWAAREEIQQQNVNEDTKVYVTMTGKKYHSDNCRYLSKSKIPISLKVAIQRGYTPCSVCSPPVLDISRPKVEKPREAKTSSSVTVYITKTGKKYHRGSCSYLRQSKISILLNNACARGYTPCSRCNPPKCKIN